MNIKKSSLMLLSFFMILGIGLFSPPDVGADVLSQEWSQKWGTIDNDSPRFIATGPTDAVYITGETFGSFSGHSNIGNRDIFLTKYDSEGNYLWTQQWGTVNADYVEGVATDQDDNIYITGYVVDDVSGTRDVETKAVLLKYNADGILQWTKTWGFVGFYRARGLAVDSSQNIYVTGGYVCKASSGIPQCSYTQDVFLHKFSPDGVTLWSQYWGTDKNSDGANGVAVGNFGEVYVTGFTGGDIDNTPHVGLYGLENIFVTKFDVDGNKFWTVQWGTEQRESPQHISVDSAGNLYVTGSTEGGFNETQNLHRLADVFLSKLTADGIVEWTSQWGYSGATERGYKTSVTANDEIYVSGYYAEGPFLAKYDSSGSQQWLMSPTIGRQVALDTIGNIYVTGPQNYDAVLVKYQSPNAPPTVSAGGPYQGQEGAGISLLSDVNDPNGDVLSYQWESNSDTCTFDSTTIANPILSCLDDGVYTVLLTVSDGINPSVSSEAAVTVTNVAPSILGLTTPQEPVNINEQPINVTVDFTDPGLLDAHDVTWNWGDGNVDMDLNALSPVTRSYSYAEPGTYTIEVTVADKDGGLDSAFYNYIVIYDPDGGFVTGGGWIWSESNWCQLGEVCSSAEGKAHFGFFSRYKKGANVPTGNTMFNFKAGELDFRADQYDWLIVTGGNYARYKGAGTINEALAPNNELYKFQIWAGDETGSDGDDTFRIKIWYEIEDTEFVVYDNGSDQSIRAGNIQVKNK